MHAPSGPSRPAARLLAGARLALRLLGALLLCGGALRSVPAAGQESNLEAEYQLKAAFVSKFPEFAEWPESALDGRAAIRLCVAAPDPFGELLNELVEGVVLRDRSLETRRVGDTGALDGCHVLFVSSLAGRRAQLLSRAANLAVLTVGDYPGFLDEGGIIELRMMDGRVRFEVDLTAANRAGVRLSSQLLRLAVTVRGAP